MTGLLRNAIGEGMTPSEKLIACGENVGNLVFWEAIERLFSPKAVRYGDAEGLKSCEKVIVTDLIWIHENAEFLYLEKIVDAYPIPFIPISIGLQSGGYDPSFKLSASLVRLLKKMEERAMLGVRGAYTESILEKYGIKNIRPIGCPSMYEWNNRSLRISAGSQQGRCSANFRSFFGRLSVPEKHFLSYCARHAMLFIEQTKWKFTPEQANDAAYYRYVSQWLRENSVLPLEVREWERALRGIGFSMGGRFHGNVFALWNGIKALFLTVDSRTEELTNFFGLPAMPMSRFDWERGIEWYYDLADYSRFNRMYPKLYDNFCGFARKNGLKIKGAQPLSFVSRSSE